MMLQLLLRKEEKIEQYAREEKETPVGWAIDLEEENLIQIPISFWLI